MKTTKFPTELKEPAGLALALASLLLVAYHVRYLVLTNYGSVAARSAWVDAFYFVSGLGHQAFTVYFVVQGWVLAGRLRERRHCRSVFVLKAAGTYAMLLPVLLLGLLLDGTGSRYLNRTGLYTAFPDFAVLSLDAPTLLGQLLLVQPFAVPTFGTNGVLWVLAFEWWYSCLFLLLSWLMRQRRALAWGMLAALAGALLAGFPSEFVNWGLIWLLGVAVAYARTRVPLALALPVFLLTLVLSRYMESQSAWLLGPNGLAFSFLKDSTFAAGFALLLLALRRGGGRLTPSFSTAVFFGHFPLMMFIIALGARWQPLKQQPGAASLLWFVLATLLIYLCGWVLYRALLYCIRDGADGR
ncbi:MAG: hypothetical protein ACLGI6_22000 [Gammaproteobacteria bacterium]